MPQNSQGLHHFHKRKISQKNNKKLSHKDKLKKVMDDAVYILGVVGQILALPQIFKIWLSKNAAGVSAIAWVSFLLGACFWVTYGIIHKEKPIIFTYSVWIMIDSMVIIGTVLYG